jgi:hypothetical protein
MGSSGRTKEWTKVQRRLKSGLTVPSQGPFLRRHYPASTVVRPCPTPARSTAMSDVEAATSDLTGLPPIARITLPTCRVQYPGRPNKCMCRLLPCPRGLPQAKDGSASASTLSRPARTSLALQPTGSLDRPKRPLSPGLGQLPSRTARQLPDQSTTVWMESSSIGDTRLRGALLPAW